MALWLMEARGLKCKKFKDNNQSLKVTTTLLVYSTTQIALTDRQIKFTGFPYLLKMSEQRGKSNH